MTSSRPAKQIGKDRHARILTAAIEIFSKSSLEAATTDQIARSARVSKRDLYAAFPDKHAIVSAVVEMILKTGDESFRRVILDSRQGGASPQERLEMIGLAMIGEILTPATGFVCRLVTCETGGQPSAGEAYFRNWYIRRSRLIAQVFSNHLAQSKRKNFRTPDTAEASNQFLALVTHLPQLTAFLGARKSWNPKVIQVHVKRAVECFLKAHPELS